MDSRPKASRFLHHGRSAFSLVELLAVIAILGVLAALLVVVVGKVKDSARRSESLSNVRQVASSMLIYAGDNRGSLPYGQYLGSWYYVNAGQMTAYLPKNASIWFSSIVTQAQFGSDPYPSISFAEGGEWKGRLRTSPVISGLADSSYYNNTGRQKPTTVERGILMTTIARPANAMLVANLDTNNCGGYGDGYAMVGFADGSASRVRDDSWKDGVASAANSVYKRWLTTNGNQPVQGYDY
ncbi:MAG: prepilin-type N-terminal cleavage/methylation domain-containing protein [Opitutaceae bacterium]|jgi:prepilin-type N-terminal cleavage/methylation domain-containing protein